MDIFSVSIFPEEGMPNSGPFWYESLDVPLNLDLDIDLPDLPGVFEAQPDLSGTHSGPQSSEPRSEPSEPYEGLSKAEISRRKNKEVQARYRQKQKVSRRRMVHRHGLVFLEQGRSHPDSIAPGRRAGQATPP